MKRFSVTDAPLTVYGVPEFSRTGRLRRLPDGLIAELGGIFDLLGHRVPGARVGYYYARALWIIYMGDDRMAEYFPASLLPEKK